MTQTIKFNISFNNLQAAAAVSQSNLHDRKTFFTHPTMCQIWWRLKRVNAPFSLIKSFRSLKIFTIPTGDLGLLFILAGVFHTRTHCVCILVWLSLHYTIESHTLTHTHPNHVEPTPPPPDTCCILCAHECMYILQSNYKNMRTISCHTISYIIALWYVSHDERYPARWR